MAVRGRVLERLTIEVVSDRELLGLVRDAADIDGWVHVLDVVKKVGLRARNPEACVSGRFRYMAKQGQVERHPQYRGTWRLTEFGNTMANAALDPTERAQVEAMAADRLLDLTTVLTQRWREQDPKAAVLIRREITYGTGRRG